jgi:hypothetical protein
MEHSVFLTPFVRNIQEYRWCCSSEFRGRKEIYLLCMRSNLALQLHGIRWMRKKFDMKVKLRKVCQSSEKIGKVFEKIQCKVKSIFMTRQIIYGNSHEVRIKFVSEKSI